ncbi:hypothetical protein Bbelb_208360 [Branchiostoma belcheri]|nr:hypothetical protein Bbelb_208360 [Branchiostoma belcheri]
MRRICVRQTNWRGSRLAAGTCSSATGGTSGIWGVYLRVCNVSHAPLQSHIFHTYYFTSCFWYLFGLDADISIKTSRPQNAFRENNVLAESGTSTCGHRGWDIVCRVCDSQHCCLGPLSETRVGIDGTSVEIDCRQAPLQHGISGAQYFTDKPIVHLPRIGDPSFTSPLNQIGRPSNGHYIMHYISYCLYSKIDLQTESVGFLTAITPGGTPHINLTRFRFRGRTSRINGLALPDTVVLMGKMEPGSGTPPEALSAVTSPADQGRVSMMYVGRGESWCGGEIDAGFWPEQLLNSAGR